MNRMRTRKDRINRNGKAGDGICFMGTGKESQMNVNGKGKGKSLRGAE